MFHETCHCQLRDDLKSVFNHKSLFVNLLSFTCIILETIITQFPQSWHLHIVVCSKLSEVIRIWFAFQFVKFCFFSKSLECLGWYLILFSYSKSFSINGHRWSINDRKAKKTNISWVLLMVPKGQVTVPLKTVRIPGKTWDRSRI